jgi:hypothetical protein
MAVSTLPVFMQERLSTIQAFTYTDLDILAVNAVRHKISLSSLHHCT